MTGVILYGPPASGKDTVTKAITAVDPRYVHYQRVKVGPSTVSGYVMATQAELEMRRRSGDIIWENSRYGAVYAILRSSVRAIVKAGSVPVVHLGQPEGVHALTAATPDVRWLVVSLWCPRDVAAERLADRDLSNVAERLAAWDETPQLADVDVAVNTADASPSQVAELIVKTATTTVADEQ